jgi:aryl-alcohol dehydrogenase
MWVKAAGTAARDESAGERGKRRASMLITAAVVRSAREPFAMETVDLEAPRKDEILVRIAAVGLSHTDLLARDQDLPVPLPAVLGREGAGWVERVGSEVTKFARGDRVVLTFQGSEPALYGPDLLELNLSGSRRDGSSPLSREGERITGAFFRQSSFASHVLATERNTVRIDEDVPFAVLAPLGGDVQTGAGAVINTLRPQPGSSIAIFGAGATGLSAVMAARLAGCHPIVAVDIKASRLQLAETIGATHTFDPDGVDPVDAIRAITANGAEFSVETTGVPGVTGQAVGCLAPGGSCALAGVAPADAKATLDLNRLRLGRTVRGCLVGDGLPALFVPRLLDLYRLQHFPIDRMMTEYRFDDINRAADDVLSGAAVKAVLIMP